MVDYFFSDHEEIVDGFFRFFKKISTAQCFATAVSWPSGESLVLQCNCARVPLRIWELFLCGFSVAIVG